MTDIDVKLNAWEQNFVQVIAVQGESEGRTINATLIDRTGQTDGTFNAESVDRPIDLTGVTARLYCIKPDGTATFSDGTITDAENGVASFVLPYQATAAAGDVKCQILLTKSDNSTLKTIGLTLNVQESNLDEATESSDEFSALVTALGKADAAAEQTEQAKTDSETAVANANTAIGNINTKNQEMTAAESSRVAAESGRVSAENTRKSNEDARKSAETERAAAESDRASAESTRESQESSRVDAESARASAESERAAAENTRKTNEDARKTAETARASAESSRKTAETGRVSAESDRADAESARVSAESTRQSNEQTRQTQESGRVSAENSRATAENQRQTNTQTAISNAETATTNANTAADRANTAAENAEDAIAGQLDPAIDSRLAVQKNQPNGIAGLDSNGKVASAQLPEMDYVQNAEKGAPSGVATLDESGHIPPEQMNLNYSGKLVVHVSSSDGGSVSGTRVRIRNEALGSNYVQPLDALGNTVFSLLDNHTYYVVLLDYPSAYYGAAATVTITGGETQELTLTLKTEPDVVGWRINKATGAVEYTNGAKNFEPMSVAGGTLNAGSWEQHWATDVKPCLLKNMVVQYYLKKTGVFLYDYEHQANGTSSDIRSGDDGDVMNEIPLMYYKFWDSTDPDGTAWNNFALAKEPQDDSWCCNAFLNRSGVPQDTIYIPAYKGSIYNSKLRSLCGVQPTASQTIGAFRTAANANGTGYEIRDLTKDRFLVALFILFFKSLDGQATLGTGAISGGPVASGTLNDKPLFWGVPSASSGLKFMGMEFFWGNMFEWLDGIGWISSGNFGYKIRPPYNDDRSGYSDSGIAIPESGYIDTMATANGFGMVPKTTVSDEASSKFHDYYYQNSENEPIIYCGSAWGFDVHCGPFYWDNYTVASTSADIGASLFATPQ